MFTDWNLFPLIFSRWFTISFHHILELSLEPFYTFKLYISIKHLLSITFFVTANILCKTPIAEY